MLTIIVRAGAALFHYRNADAGGKLSDRRWKIDVLVIHDEAENTPAHATSETMKRLPLRTNCEGWRFFLMKWAERLESRAGAFEWKIGANHLNDIVRCGDLFDRLCWNGAH